MSPMDKQTIFRVHREERDRWTPLLNETITDARLSFRATGLLVYLLSKPADWIVRQSQLAGAKTEGRDAVITAFNELRETGYIQKEILRERGRIASTVWHVFERPRTTADRLTGKPETVQPETVQPETVNPELQRNEEDKGIIEQRKPHVPAGTTDLAIDADGNAVNADIIMAEWNRLPAPFPKIKLMTAKRKTMLRARLKCDYWINAWREALTIAPNIPFLRGEARGRGNWIMDIEFFLKPDSVTKIIEGKYGTGSSPTGPDYSSF